MEFVTNSANNTEDSIDVEPTEQVIDIKPAESVAEITDLTVSYAELASTESNVNETTDNTSAGIVEITSTKHKKRAKTVKVKAPIVLIGKNTTVQPEKYETSFNEYRGNITKDALYDYATTIFRRPINKEAFSPDKFWTGRDMPKHSKNGSEGTYKPETRMEENTVNEVIASRYNGRRARGSHLRRNDSRSVRGTSGTNVTSGTHGTNVTSDTRVAGDTRDIQNTSGTRDDYKPPLYDISKGKVIAALRDAIKLLTEDRYKAMKSLHPFIDELNMN